MKLLARYNRANIIATVIVLLLSGLCYYFVIRYVLLNQLDDDLKVEEQEIVDYAKTNNSLPNPSTYKDQQISFIANETTAVKRTFSNVAGYSREENENITLRQMVFPIVVSGKKYTVTISKSEEETEDLIRLILLLTSGIVLVLLTSLFMINRFVLNKLWAPFNNTLKEMKQFNLSNNKALALDDTRITEFADLNETVSVMSSRVRQDYNSLKTFTENASHEMQTPLAIINSRLDVLIQDESLTEFQTKQLQGIYDALDRLSNLNASLLLLTKIGNKQFSQRVPIRLDEIVSQKLDQLEELTEGKKLLIHLAADPTSIEFDPQLTDILVSNLLNNAIRYTGTEGTINIKVRNSTLSVSNTSAIPALDPDKVFKRFYRHHDTTADGNGLGLSIVSQICELGNYTATYIYKDKRHHFYIHF